MRTKIVAGNWKMNLLAHNAAELFNEIQHYLEHNDSQCTVCVFPSYIYLPALQANSGKLLVGSQNLSSEEKGAYTGEVSVDQLQSIGIKRVLVGHSERRNLYLEDADQVHKKLRLALDEDFNTFLCVGESLDQRNSNDHFKTVKHQIETALKGISSECLKNLCIAYEPVWAIGTGETASPEQAQEMHEFIRSLLKDMYDQSLSDSCSILYGGSVKPTNAKELFAQQDIDGALVGGASLDAEDFIQIIQSIS